MCLEGLLGWPGKEGGLLKLIRRGGFLSRILGVNGRDQGPANVSLGYGRYVASVSSRRMAYWTAPSGIIGLASPACKSPDFTIF